MFSDHPVLLYCPGIYGGVSNLDAALRELLEEVWLWTEARATLYALRLGSPVWVCSVYRDHGMSALEFSLRTKWDGSWLLPLSV